MRVLIVDDEAPARARLRQLLASYPDVEIAGEAKTGIEAMEMASRARLDLLLLDIQMPGGSGIDVAACLPNPRPQIVFCTAFDQQAVDAFERHAMDYLLKPISRARLAQALDRVRYLKSAPANAAPAGRPGAAAMHPTRFLVKNGQSYFAVPESRVLFFESEGGLTRVVSETGRYWMDPTLDELAERLDPTRFFRVSRAALVSLNAAADVHPLPGGSGEVVLKNGHKLEIGRRRFQDFLKALAAD